MNKPVLGRVLFFMEHSPYSRDGRARREANTLASAGYRVMVVCPRAPGEGRHEVFGAIDVYQYPAPPSVNGVLGYVVEYGYSLLATLCYALWIALREGFDVIHAHNPLDMFVVVAVIFRPLGVRFVYDQRDLSPEMYSVRFGGGSRLVRAALEFFEWLSCRWADEIIVANDSHKQLVIERTKVPAARITVVRNGPEPCHLTLAERSCKPTSDERIHIGYVGVIGYQDGIDYLLRALDTINREFNRRDWRCTIIGDGDALAELKALAGKLWLESQVEFTGWVSFREVPKLLTEVDIGVVPDPSNEYTNRSTIIKLMEYMAQAKPVAAFDLPEHRKTAGTAALYARANDSTDLARNILQLMDDADLREQLGQLGRDRAVQLLAWKHQEKHLLSVYQRVFSGRVSTAGNPIMDIASRESRLEVTRTAAVSD